MPDLPLAAIEVYVDDKGLLFIKLPHLEGVALIAEPSEARKMVRTLQHAIEEAERIRSQPPATPKKRPPIGFRQEPRET